jgi:hypothetical protein
MYGPTAQEGSSSLDEDGFSLWNQPDSAGEDRTHGCGRDRPSLSNIEVARRRAIIVIADTAEQGQNSLVTMAAGLLGLSVSGGA